MAKHETGSGEVTEVLGQKQEPAITFSFEYDAFETPAEVREAGKWPNDAAVLSFVNANEKRNAMSNARAKAVADVVAKIQETPAYKMSALVKQILIANDKLTPEQARAVAEMAINQGA